MTDSNGLVGAGNAVGAPEPLKDPAAFYSALRARGGLFAGGFRQEQVDGLTALLAAMSAAQWPLAYAAYGLATPFLETARTMQPIHEYGSNAYLSKYDTGRLAARLGNTPEADGDGQKYAGRGFVQITGAANYKKAAAKLGIDLVNSPDLAMQPDVAAKILIWGMETGSFTGKKLGDYLPATGPALNSAFVQARRIINGQDRARDIAGYADKFQAALQAGGWR